MQRLRLIVVTVALAALAATAAPSTGASKGSAKGPTQTCARIEFTSGLEVVFGRFSTEAKAQTFQRNTVRQGFQNANIICSGNQWLVVVRGMESFDIAVDLQSEARTVNIKATVECIQGKDDVGELEVVFAHRRTRADAAQFVDRAGMSGFVGLQLEPDPCGGFEIMLKGFTDRAQANDFVDQARRAGFDVVIERS